MSSGTIVGLILITTGITDALLGFFVIGPRIAEEKRRRIVQLALLIGAATMVGLGTVLLTGVLPWGRG